jgi:DNA-binding MarR family transcriptional regulator
MDMKTQDKGGMNVADAGMLDGLIRVLEEFRKLNQNVTANQMIVFLLIAQRPGLTQKDIEQATGLNNGTVSRICAILSDRGLKARGHDGLGLISIESAPGDYRVRVQFLTPQGKRVFQSIKRIME